MKGDASIGVAVDGVLRAIEDGWTDSSGNVDSASYHAMVDALAPELEALLALPSTDAKAAADRLIENWERVRIPLGW